MPAVDAQPAFLLEARLDYPDGSSSTIGTDGSWKVLAHTAFIETRPANFKGNPWDRTIQFDSRLEPPGWQRTGFDDSRWASATVVNRSDYHLFAQMAPMEREQAALKPVSITSTNGAWLVDFGRCIDGWPKITMRANHSGDVVRIEYFQMTGERRPAGWDEYTCHGGAETWDADFGRHTSFQVLKITGYAGKLKGFRRAGNLGLLRCRSRRAVFVVRALCSMTFTKCANVRRGKTFSKASSAWTPIANKRRGWPTVGILGTFCSTMTATRR